jgi:hypothetical protein
LRKRGVPVKKMTWFLEKMRRFGAQIEKLDRKAVIEALNT